MLNVDQSKRPSVLDLINKNPRIYLKVKEIKIKERQEELNQKERKLAKLESELSDREQQLSDRLAQVEEREKKVAELESILKANNPGVSNVCFQPLSSRYSNSTTVNTNESHHMTRHLSFKSVEQAFDKSSNSYKASVISNYNSTVKKSHLTEAPESVSKRHHPNSLSVQSGILSHASAKNCMEFKSRNDGEYPKIPLFILYIDSKRGYTVNSPLPTQSPHSDPKHGIQSVISENSEEAKLDGESDNFEKAEPQTAKVTDSMDKIFKQERTNRQSKKILMIGEKRMTSEISSSESRERELVKRNRNPLMLKNKECKERNSARKIKGSNINKELAKKYANKLELGKVSFYFLKHCRNV